MLLAAVGGGSGQFSDFFSAALSSFSMAELVIGPASKLFGIDSPYVLLA